MPCIAVYMGPEAFDADCFTQAFHDGVFGLDEGSVAAPFCAPTIQDRSTGCSMHFTVR
jgi:hypothetical protein